MEKYRPTKAEILRMRREKVRWAKESIKSLNCGMEKFEKGSTCEAGYLKEKMASLDKSIKSMIKGDY